MQDQELGGCIRRDPLDRRLIVGQVLHQCKCYMANIWDAPNLQRVAAASLALFEPRRAGAEPWVSADAAHGPARLA